MESVIFPGAGLRRRIWSVAGESEEEMLACVVGAGGGATEEAEVVEEFINVDGGGGGWINAGAVMGAVSGSA